MLTAKANILTVAGIGGLDVKDFGGATGGLLNGFFA